ncbi:hypothetical protein [Mangrovihabitans endophyticus]|uniref:Uncharacterized protein n=1 Tax=Mangrovihabitans endophyticus TaxID=1751298 RepID=A0A8J3BWT3_9ACTN|nr:hypothetical protein [Mangrovihabitans endophyticus]GGK84575.1 hypothetical protein GCM10012284_18620 [Mangrovihabitans endophyticus]
METTLHSFLLAVPQAAAIWMLLLLVAVAALALLALPDRRPEAAASVRHTPGFPAGSGPGGPPGGVAGETPDDEVRYESELAVATDRAATTATRMRTQWELAQEAVDTAWAAYEDADTAARRVIAATAYPVRRARRSRDERADRERFLHHAALAACRNRQISIAQLNDVLAHRGWDARLHPVMQEAALCRAVRAHRFACYQAAVAAERDAWAESERAAEALRGLRTEQRLVGATVKTDWWAEQWATTQPLPVARPVGSTVDGVHPIAA